MSKLLKETAILLDAVEIEMGRGAFKSGKPPRRIVGWSGPGVVFATRLKNLDNSGKVHLCEPLTVVTPHAHSAAWILNKIELAFAPLLGPHIEQDFFERIAEAVSEYGTVMPLEKDSDINLLRVILREARDTLSDMETGEFPYVPSGSELGTESGQI